MAECFTVNSQQIEGRIDSYYYRPEFIQIIKLIKKGKYRYIKFKDIIDDISGGATPRVEGDYYSDSGIPFLRVQNITEEGILLEDVKYIKKEVHEGMLKRSQLHENELIFTITGRIGSVAVVPNGFDGNINQHSVRIRLKESLNNIKISPEYIALFFNLELGRKISFRNTTGGTRPALDYTAINDLILPLPEYENQKGILNKIKQAYQSKKQKESEAQKLLDSISDYVLDELGIIIPELNDKMCYTVNSDEIENRRVDVYYYQPKFEEVDKAIKKGKYEVKKLKYFITKIHYGASVKNEYVDEGIPLLRITNLKPMKIYITDVVKLPESMRKELGNAFVKEGEFLISRSGTVGIVSVVPKEAEGYAFGSFMIKFCLNDNINRDYVSIWLNTKIEKLLTEREKIGAIQGNITIDTIENFIIPIPPIPIQNKISNEVKKRMQKAEQLHQEARELIENVKAEVEKMILEK